MSQGQKVPAGLPKWAVLISDYARAAADDDVKKAHSIWFEIMDFMAERENESAALSLRERRMREALREPLEIAERVMTADPFDPPHEAEIRAVGCIFLNYLPALRAALAQETQEVPASVIGEKP